MYPCVGDRDPALCPLDAEYEQGKRAIVLLREARNWLQDASAYAQDGEPSDFDARVAALLAEVEAQETPRGG